MRITEYLTLTAGAIGLAAILAGCGGVPNSDSIDQKVKNAPKTEQRTRHQPVVQSPNSEASPKGASGNGYDGPSYEELIKKSSEAIRAKDYERGLRLAEQARVLNGNNAQPLINISTAYIKTGKFDQAIKIAQDANEDFPSNFLLVTNLAIAYLKKEDNRQALQYFEQAHQIRPSDKKVEKWMKYLRNHQ